MNNKAFVNNNLINLISNHISLDTTKRELTEEEKNHIETNILRSLFDPPSKISLNVSRIKIKKAKITLSSLKLSNISLSSSHDILVLLKNNKGEISYGYFTNCNNMQHCEYHAGFPTLIYAIGSSQLRQDSISKGNKQLTIYHNGLSIEELIFAVENLSALKERGIRYPNKNSPFRWGPPHGKSTPRIDSLIKVINDELNDQANPTKVGAYINRLLQEAKVTDEDTYRSLKEYLSFWFIKTGMIEALAYLSNEFLLDIAVKMRTIWEGYGDDIELAGTITKDFTQNICPFLERSTQLLSNPDLLSDHPRNFIDLLELSFMLITGKLRLANDNSSPIFTDELKNITITLLLLLTYYLKEYIPSEPTKDIVVSLIEAFENYIPNLQDSDKNIFPRRIVSRKTYTEKVIKKLNMLAEKIKLTIQHDYITDSEDIVL
jgi:hypothetical protein